MTADPAPVPEPVAPPQLVPPLLPTPQAVRYLIVFGVVCGWIALGWIFNLGPINYLLIGIPLLAIFQLGIARRPLSELWIRPAAPAPFPWWGYLVAAAFMVVPVVKLIRLPGNMPWNIQVWYGCAMLGAIPLAFTITRFSSATLRSLLLCLATGGVLGVMKMLGGAWLTHHLTGLTAGRTWFGTQQFLLLLPVCFVVEEVFFRGGLDSYLHQPGDRLPWLSAAFLSSLWGWWHLPVSGIHGILPFMMALLTLPLLHLVTGIPYSLFWRRSGSLLVPATTHALVDAVRNMFLR
jgi:membrane protease YdiL (CAAX protease family)